MTDPRSEFHRHADRATIDIGMFALKAGMISNSGGALAMLAAYPNLRAHPDLKSALVCASSYFLFGLVISMVSAGLAYIYQWQLTDNVAAGEKSQRTNDILVRCRWGLAIFVAASYVLFILGAKEILLSF